MLLLQYHHHHTLTLYPQTFRSPHSRHRRRPPSYYVGKPSSLFSPSALPLTSLYQWVAEIADPTTVLVPVPLPDDAGPVELPFPSLTSIFDTADDPSPIQIATSVMLTGAIFVFLFRSIRRRIKRAKELRFRSSGAKKTLKEEALESLKAMGEAAPIENKKPTSPVQALVGGIAAGLIALVLYKFTTTIEASLNRQTISDNFSVRQITITIRTIINGVCYLATFVFGFNAIGLIVYSAQLTLNSLLDGSSGEETARAQVDEPSDALDLTSEGAGDCAESQSSQTDQNSDDSR